MTMGITGTIYSSVSLCVFNVATFKITFVCMWGGVSACHDLCDGQRTTWGSGSLLLPCGFLESTQVHQAWQHVPLPDKPSSRSSYQTFQNYMCSSDCISIECC